MYIPTKDDRNYLSYRYTEMPSIDTSDEVMEAWESLVRESLTHVKILRTHFLIEYVEFEPYTKVSQMFSDLENNKIQLSVLNLDHPIFSHTSNIAFRIAHDILGHWKMGTCHNMFSFVGEIDAFRSQARYLRNPASKKALFSSFVPIVTRIQLLSFTEPLRFLTSMSLSVISLKK